MMIRIFIFIAIIINGISQNAFAQSDPPITEAFSQEQAQSVYHPESSEYAQGILQHLQDLQEAQDTHNKAKDKPKKQPKIDIDKILF